MFQFVCHVWARRALVCSAVALLSFGGGMAAFAHEDAASVSVEPVNAALDIPVMAAKDVDVERAALNDVTHPPLRLTPDKSTLIDLGAPAGSIVIGNPLHFNVLLDSAQRVIVVPRLQGASFLTVLDKDGGVLMQRHVIVGMNSVDNRYMRVRRVCSSNDKNCQPTSVYYCPDMCHEIRTSDGSTKNSGQEGASSGPMFSAEFNMNPSDGDGSSAAQSAPPQPRPEELSVE